MVHFFACLSDIRNDINGHMLIRTGNKNTFLLEIMYFIKRYAKLGINKSQGTFLGYTQPIRW